MEYYQTNIVGLKYITLVANKFLANRDPLET